MIEQLAFIIALLLCLMFAFAVGAVMAVVGINVLCLSALCYVRAKGYLNDRDFKKWLLWPASLVKWIGRAAFAPAYWALAKIEEEGK